MDKLSVSAADLFKACPRQFYYKEILGWESTKKASWLVKGSAYDKLLEYYDLEGVAGANKHIPELFPNPFHALDAQFVLAHYHGKFKDDPLPPVEGGNQHGFGVVFKGNEATGPMEFKVTGYIDKLSQRGNELIVTERKTTAEDLDDGSASIEDGAEFWKKLPLNTQIRLYIWYLRTKGANCGWVNYEVIRKPSTTFNKVFDKKNVSLEQYREDLMRFEPKKTLVARKSIFITEEMTEEFIIDHALVYKQIQACKQHQAELELMGLDGALAWVKHEGSCKNYGGCVFKDVDEHKTTLEKGDYVKSEKWLKKQAKEKK